LGANTAKRKFKTKQANSINHSTKPEATKLKLRTPAPFDWNKLKQAMSFNILRGRNTEGKRQTFTIPLKRQNPIVQALFGEIKTKQMKINETDGAKHIGTQIDHLPTEEVKHVGFRTKNSQR
jgi:hypothetical protein